MNTDQLTEAEIEAAYANMPAAERAVIDSIALGLIAAMKARSRDKYVQFSERSARELLARLGVLCASHPVKISIQ